MDEINGDVRVKTNRFIGLKESAEKKTMDEFFDKIVLVRSHPQLVERSGDFSLSHIVEEITGNQVLVSHALLKSFVGLSGLVGLKELSDPGEVSLRTFRVIDETVDHFQAEPATRYGD